MSHSFRKSIVMENKQTYVITVNNSRVKRFLLIFFLPIKNKNVVLRLLSEFVEKNRNG